MDRRPQDKKDKVWAHRWETVCCFKAPWCTGTHGRLFGPTRRAPLGHSSRTALRHQGLGPLSEAQPVPLLPSSWGNLSLISGEACSLPPAKSLQSCPTLCNPMDCSLSGSSVHGIFQARVLEWGASAFSALFLLQLLNILLIPPNTLISLRI